MQLEVHGTRGFHDETGVGGMIMEADRIGDRRARHAGHQRGNGTGGNEKTPPSDQAAGRAPAILLSLAAGLDVLDHDFHGNYCPKSRLYYPNPRVVSREIPSR